MTAKSYYSGNGKLALGDGSQLFISYIGHFNLPGFKPLHLRNILLVPSITKNLISISKFTLENDVIVDKRSKEILLQGSLKNGLYLLNLNSTSSAHSSSDCHNSFNTQFSTQRNFGAPPTCVHGIDVSSSACNAQSLLNLWHSRLGNLNKLVLQKVLSQLNVQVPSHTNFMFCDASQYGKLHQNSLFHYTAYKTPFQ